MFFLDNNLIFLYFFREFLDCINIDFFVFFVVIWIVMKFYLDSNRNIV